jgi:hypothetical protein
MKVVPLHKELANGTEHDILKWFKLLGIILFLCACGYIGMLAYLAQVH